MSIYNQTQRAGVKRVKFHHRVKRFYHKNLFGKIYTIAIIGLIGANLFSLLKYQTFADELESDMLNIIGAENDPYLETQDSPDKLPSEWVEGVDFYPITVSNGEKEFTIMDRNLGASAVAEGIYSKGDGLYANSGEALNKLGYYYQWGNNYGFLNEGSITLGNVQVDASSYGPNMINGYYISSTYYSEGQNWDSSDNRNLRGGERDTVQSRGKGTDADRRGPCPVGYHIPSTLEWDDAYWIRNNSSTTIIYNGITKDKTTTYSYAPQNFTHDLHLPFAGSRGVVSRTKAHNQGAEGNYWSSSASDDGMVDAYSLSIKFNSLSTQVQTPRSLGYSIRCFKDSLSKTLNFDYNGGNTSYNQPNSTLSWWGIAQDLSSASNTTKHGYTFEGWYTTSDFKEGTQVTTNDISYAGNNTTITLYAKWEKCPDGYSNVINNKCISDDVLVYYEDGYIEITDGDKVVYIKDRNQGASISAQKIIEIQKLKEEYNMCHDGGMALESIGPRGGNILRAPTNPESDFFGEVSDIIGAEVTTCEEIDEYIDEVMPLSYGDYYYRGNNNGASRDELGVDFDSMRADVPQQAISRGFDGGHLGEPEGKGWIEGNIQANPCNAEDGEYLPTVDDWKKAMEIWSETKGYDLNINDYDDNGYNYGYIYYDSEFMNDILVPNAGYIKYDYEALTYNKQDNTDKMNLLALLFANPVMAEYQGMWDFVSYIQNGYPYLWSAVDSGHKFGSFDEGNNRYDYRNIDINEYDYEINAKATPVRCFIDPDYVNSIVKYTVTFDTKGGNETVPAQTVKEGKKLKEPATPTRDGYTFDGWYTSAGTKWIFDTDTVQSEMTLYAKWRLCGEGFVVENNKCIPEGMELNGVIKVTGELGTMYIRDRNVGVSDAAVNLLRFYSLMDKRDIECQNSSDDICRSKKYINGTGEVKEILGIQYNDILEAETDIYSKVMEGILTPEEKDYFTKYAIIDNNYISAQCDLEGWPDNCYENKWLDYINEKMGKDSEDFEELDNYDDTRGALRDKYGDDVVDKDYFRILNNQANGNYYYRGNNNGVNYNDIKFEDPDNWMNVTNMEELIERGFTEGKIGVEGQGWIEGKPNPCDPDKGEFLPTPEDWIDIMEIWGNSKGYHMESDNNEGINSIGIFDDDGYNIWLDFGSDILVPQAGRISGGRFVRASNLWSAENDGDNLGYYHDGSFYYGNKSVSEEIGGNTYAMPVRCFVNPAEIPDVYVVSYETNGGDNDIPEVNVISGDTLILPTPSKANYTFGGWYRDKSLTEAFEPSSSVTSDLVLYAKRDVETQPDTPSIEPTQPSKPTNSYSGGGGRGGASNILDKRHGSADENKSEVNEGQTENKEQTEKENQSENSEDKNTQGQQDSQIPSSQFQEGQTYSQETIDAYNFAKSNGITSKSTIKEANMTGEMTRIAMAKMLSNYAINILGYKPDPTRVKKFVDVTDKLNKEYDDAVTLSYQLGIMGINVPKDRFRPKDIITRAEFATALSRMLYRIADGAGKTKYYRPHIVKLYQEGIISKTSPSLIEKRGYVMLMLMRSAK